MSTVNETTRVFQWLRTILRSDATLNAAVGGRIYEGHVPSRKALPAVVFSIDSWGEDLRPAGPDRLWSKPRVLVKAIGETNSATALQTIADRIDAVLDEARGGTADCTVDYCIRNRPFYMKETEEEAGVPDKVWVHLGGLYDLAIRYTP